MLVSVASFAVMDALLKLLSEHYPALQVAFLRAAASLPFVLLLVALRGRLARLRPVNVRLHLVRGALSVLLLYSFIIAVRESSLATTYSIFMCAPLLVAALSVPMLSERVVSGQWVAIAAGLAGVLLMLGPVNGKWAVVRDAVGDRRAVDLRLRRDFTAPAGAHRYDREHGRRLHAAADGRRRVAGDSGLDRGPVAACCR